MYEQFPESADKAAIFQLNGVDVEVEPVDGSAIWRARVVAADGAPVSGWVAGRRAWQAVELAVAAQR